MQGKSVAEAKQWHTVKTGHNPLHLHSNGLETSLWFMFMIFVSVGKNITCLPAGVTLPLSIDTVFNG